MFRLNVMADADMRKEILNLVREQLKPVTQDFFKGNMTDWLNQKFSEVAEKEFKKMLWEYANKYSYGVGQTQIGRDYEKVMQLIRAETQKLLTVDVLKKHLNENMEELFKKYLSNKLQSVVADLVRQELASLGTKAK